jgi:TolA-binding protein
MSHLRLALAGVLASTALASAEAPNRPAVDVDVKLSARVKPKERTTVPTAGPVGAEKILEIEVLTSPIHAEQEQILVKLIAATPDTDVDEKSELYFRLAELYAKQSRLFRLQSVELDLKKKPAASKQAAETAQRYLAKAAVTYKSLTETSAFQNFAKMDLALFVYAYTLQAGRYYPQARAVYDKLLKNYPASKFVAEAHLAFAEHYWEAGQLDDAEDRYKLVLASPKSNAYWYAMYKIGWIQLNRKRPDEALETFFQVAKATERDPKREVLYRNAKKDFVRAYAEVGKVDKALVAFKRVDASGALEMFETLAGFYMDQGKSDKAIYSYRELMKLSPKHVNVCLWQYEVAHSMLTLPGATNVDRVREITDLNRLYTALSAKLLPATQASECRDNAAAMSGELARAFHGEYAKTYSNDSFTAASKLYAVYLAAFPDAADAPTSAYYRADLLWARAERERDARLKTELWEQTAVAFMELVKTGKLDPKFLNDAAYAGVRAYLYAHESDPRAAAPGAEATPDAPPKQKPIPQREQQMLAAFDLYLAKTKSPPEDELVQMKFLKANVLRRFGHLIEAIPLFTDIMARHPQHAAAQEAALMLVDVYILQNDETALLELTDQMLANAKLLADNPELKKKLERIKTVALRKRAQEIEARAKKSGDFATYVACGLAYLDIYNRNPEDD